MTEYRILFSAHGIGDLVVTASLPENFYNLTGQKLIVDDHQAKWVFKYNPYVVFSSKEHNIKTLQTLCDTRHREIVEKYIGDRGTTIISSQAEWLLYCLNLDIDKLSLRNPRLYIHEDLPQIQKKLTVHTTGSNRSLVGEAQIRYGLGENSERIMSDEVIERILCNYKDWEIVQVGGENDKLLGGHSIDKRGILDLFDVAKEIATSQRFIGTNSGLMHLANAYPKVEKRIILMEFSELTLGKGFQNIPFRAGEIRNFLFSWLDPSNKFYNKYSTDIGVTSSFIKI